MKKHNKNVIKNTLININLLLLLNTILIAFWYTLIKLRNTTQKGFENKLGNFFCGNNLN